MKFRMNTIFVLTLLLFLGSSLKAANLSGTYSIPGTVAGTTVNNLTQLATLLNASTVSGTVIFEFSSSYTSAAESYPIIFVGYSGIGNVIIRPDASVSTALNTSGSPASNALVDLSGVKNITFDGRPGGAGSTVKWQFQNTASSGSYPAFVFINGAAHNTLQYLTILSSGTSTTGTVVLSTSTLAGGNSYDVIQYCNIGNNVGYPYNPVLSLGTAGVNANSNNSILYNNIYNYQTYNNTSPFYAGINITATGNGGNWNITGNSLYSTINPLALGGYTCEAIYFVPGSSSTGNVISGNYIGGTQAQCGGTPWKVPAYGANGYADFDGIYIAAGGTTTVSNNTIQNIWMASKYGSSTFRGINIISGAANVTGNTIGSATATSSILSGLYGTMMGIQNQSSSAVTINNNTIAGFTADGVSYVSGTSGTTTGVSIGIYGYNNGLLGATTITNNKIFNFSRIDNYNNNLYFPVNTGSGTLGGIQDIYQMNIIAGICVQTTGSASQVISKNTIYNLCDSLSGATNKIFINGIVANAAGGTHTINGNLVYGLWALDNFGGSGYFYGLNGIYLTSDFAGTYNVTDNMVDLGYKYLNGASVQNALIHGIWDNAGLNSTNLKFHVNHNSVFIGGTNTNAFSNNLNSYAFSRNLSYSSSVYDSLSVFNNIFVNNRSTTTGTGKNYGFYLNDALDVTDDYNDVYGTGTGFYYGHATSDYVSLLAFNSSVAGHEATSISADPLFNSPTTATPDLHIQAGSPVDQAGLASATIVYDYDSLIRANYSPVDIGATVVCSSASAATVSLAVSQDTVCTGTQVTFTATPGNGGTSPNYNFYLNGNSVQNGTTNTYAATLNNNDSVKVVLTSSAACASPAVATSSNIKVTVTGSSTVPLVSVTPSQNNICHGTQVVFTASPTYGGTAPVYNFYVNNTSVQNGVTGTYASASLNNNDSVWVVMTSNASCLATTTATSAKVLMVVNSIVVPSVSVNPSATNICGGTGVTFTATPTNGGTPVYHWRKNGILVGTTGNTYSDNTLVNGDVIKCTLISNALCAVPDSAVSSPITMTVGSSATTNLTDSFCVNGGYNFRGQTITTAGTYYDTLHTILGCDSFIVLTLTTAASPAAIVTANADSLSTTSFASYQWLLNDVPVGGATTRTYVALQNGTYSVVVTNAIGCIDTSAPVTVLSTSLSALTDRFNIQLYPNPTPGDLNIHVAVVQGNVMGIKLYDVYGKLIRDVQEVTNNHQYSSVLNLNDLAGGIYFLQMQFDGVNLAKRVEVVR